MPDIGLTEQQIKDNLMFGTDKIGSTMTVAMIPAEAKNWFGTVPPDLSVESRVRGSDWLYNYFLAFYRDDQTTTGWNNLVFPNVAMPHVLVAAFGTGQAGRRPSSKATKRRSRRPLPSRGSRNSNRPQAASGS